MKQHTISKLVLLVILSLVAFNGLVHAQKSQVIVGAQGVALSSKALLPPREQGLSVSFDPSVVYSNDTGVNRTTNILVIPAKKPKTYASIIVKQLYPIPGDELNCPDYTKTCQYSAPYGEKKLRQPRGVTFLITNTDTKETIQTNLLINIGDGPKTTTPIITATSTVSPSATETLQQRLDFNNDRKVDCADLAILKNTFNFKALDLVRNGWINGGDVSKWISYKNSGNMLGDINNDKLIDDKDLGILKSNFLYRSTDLNNDGYITIVDFGLFSSVSPRPNCLPSSTPTLTPTFIPINTATPTEYIGPDFTITDTGMIFTQKSTNLVNVTFTIINQGLTSVPMSLIYTGQADGMSSLASDNTCTGSTVLSTGGTCVSSYDFSFPTSGTKKLTIAIDPNNQVNESDETNNIFSGEWTVVLSAFTPTSTPTIDYSPTPASFNMKDLSKFSSKNVFLVSDEDWRQVLALVPLVVWTNADDTVTKYPFSVYHRESNAFDIDSTFNFFEQYNPDKISYFGDLPSALDSLLQNAYTIEQKQDTLSYWAEYNDVVYVENNYELALFASTYASLINAPLIIEGYNDTTDFSQKNVICVGNLTSSCDVNYNLSQLQEEYRNLTNSDKIILTNTDLNISISDTKATLHGSTITQLFGKTSLISAYLASSKKELIIPVSSTGAESVDNTMKHVINELNFNPNYLTILASPLEIQNTIRFTKENGTEASWSIDNTKYGNLDNDSFGFAELRTGRIYGFSSSDVSSYIARVLFYDDLSKADEVLTIGQGVGATDGRAKRLANVFNNEGYETDYKTYSDPASPTDWENKMIINDDAHGTEYYSTILTDEIPILSNTIIFSVSCSTCAFDKLITANYGRLFCLELLRKGSLGVIIPVDNSGYTWDSTRLNSILSKDIGTTSLKVQNLDHARSKWYAEDVAKTFDYRYLQADVQMLLGDPTLKVPFNEVVLPDVQQNITYAPDIISVNVTIPSENIEDDGTTYAFIEGTDDFVQARYAKFFLKIGPINLFENYSVESDDVDPMFYGGIKDVAVQQEEDGKYIYFVLEKDVSSNALNTIVSNNINIDIIQQSPMATATLTLTTTETYTPPIPTNTLTSTFTPTSTLYFTPNQY